MLILPPLLLLTAAWAAGPGLEVAYSPAPAELAGTERHFITTYSDGAFAFFEADEDPEPASPLPVFDRLHRERIAEEAMTPPVESIDDGPPSDPRVP